MERIYHGVFLSFDFTFAITAMMNNLYGKLKLTGTETEVREQFIFKERRGHGVRAFMKRTMKPALAVYMI